MPLTSSIPLLCNICPRRPNFSDVSHLLTHIASKGHLSHYYKLRVRSSTERSSKELIDAYDQWYRNWNVEKLMAERMRLKDRKKAKVQGSLHELNDFYVLTLILLEVNGQNRHKERKGRSGPCNEGYNRTLEHISNLTNTSRAHFSNLDAAHIHQNYASRIRLWDASMLTPISSSVSDYEHNGSSLDATDRASFTSVTNNSSVNSLLLDNEEISIEDDSFVADNAKLKGVLWPGMDIFDSATPEMRRKRNQKKDVSVVEQLESNSLEVEPTEVIFAPDGTEWRSRAISGMPYDDGYPFQELSPSHQQLNTYERAPLSEIDANRSGSGGSHPAWNRQTRRKTTLSTEKSKENLAPSDATMNAMADKKQPAANEPNRKRKKEFDVFRDEINFSNPAGLSHLTAEFASPGLASSDIGLSHNSRPVWAREGSIDNHPFGISKDSKSRHNPRRSYQRQNRRCASSSLASSNKSNEHAVPSYSSHSVMEPHARLPQYIATGGNLGTNQHPGQSFLQPQLDQQQEQQHNSLLNNLIVPQNDAYLTTLHGPFHQSSETVARLGSVLQDFPYYLSQMPYLSDNLTVSNSFGNTATIDPIKGGTSQRTSNLNFPMQNSLQPDVSQSGFNTYDLPIEEQLRLYASNEVIDGNGRGLGGILEHGNCYGCYHHQNHFINDRETETEDDQKTISAPPSER